MTQLEYLGEGIVEIAGVGVFGRERFDRERKEWIRITTLPCPEEIAAQFEADAKFKIHRPLTPPLPRRERARVRGQKEE